MEVIHFSINPCESCGSVQSCIAATNQDANSVTPADFLAAVSQTDLTVIQRLDLLGAFP